MNNKVSVCTIAKNCADIVEVMLRWATENFEEINIVVDTENSDNTLELLRSWVPKINLKEHKFDNFSAQKQRAFDMATTPWVLSVDTDEIYESHIPWDMLVYGLDKSGKDVGAFHLYNIQRDLHHYKPPIEPKVRLIRREVAHMDGKPVDEGIRFTRGNMIVFPYAHIHFGHVRHIDALKLKGKDRVVFKDQDPCDGPGLNAHGEDWFIERNKAWDDIVVSCPKEVEKTIERYW